MIKYINIDGLIFVILLFFIKNLFFIHYTHQILTFPHYRDFEIAILETSIHFRNNYTLISCNVAFGPSMDSLFYLIGCRRVAYSKDHNVQCFTSR
jgi:hypothetical protein